MRAALKILPILAAIAAALFLARGRHPTRRPIWPGRAIALAPLADDLVALCDGGDIFLIDRRTGRIQLVAHLIGLPAWLVSDNGRALACALDGSMVLLRPDSKPLSLRASGGLTAAPALSGDTLALPLAGGELQVQSLSGGASRSIRLPGRPTLACTLAGRSAIVPLQRSRTAFVDLPSRTASLGLRGVSMAAFTPGPPPLYAAADGTIYTPAEGRLRAVGSAGAYVSAISTTAGYVAAIVAGRRLLCGRFERTIGWLTAHRLPAAPAAGPCAVVWNSTPGWAVCLANGRTIIYPRTGPGRLAELALPGRPLAVTGGDGWVAIASESGIYICRPS